METNENQNTSGNNPGQQPPGYQQSGEQRDREGEQNAYGQDKDATNQNRDGQHSNAASQSNEGQHPNPANQNREGQQSQTNEPAGDKPSSTGNERQNNEDDPNGMKDADKVIPEVPQREEEREQQTPEAGKTANREGIDRFDSNSSDKGTIDDSSKFSE